MDETPPPPFSDPKPSDAKARPDGVRVSAPKCVRCGKPVEPRNRPFCSQLCADMDLGAWVMGTYRVATDEAPADDAGEGLVQAPKADPTR